MTAKAVSPEGESNVMPSEFVQLPVVPETSIDVPSLQVINVVEPVHHEIWERIHKMANGEIVHKASSPKHPLPRNDAQQAESMRVQPSCDATRSEVAFFTAQGTQGILDTGATKSVIGSRHLPALLGSAVSLLVVYMVCEL